MASSNMRLRFDWKTASMFNISQQRVRVPVASKNVCFAAASTEWPSLSSSSSPSPPLLLLPPDSNSNERVVFSLAENKVVKLPNQGVLAEEICDAHCAGSSHGWLAYVNGPKCGIYLANLFSPEIIQLPDVETLPSVKRVFRDPSSNLVKEYNFHNSRPTPLRFSQSLINRFAMSSPPNNNNCTVMVSNGILQQLAFCRIGDTSWTPLEHQIEDFFEEVIYSNKDQLFYGLSSKGDIEAWDLRDPTSPKSTLISLGIGDNQIKPYDPEGDFRDLCRRQSYLVELSGGDILYVDRYFTFVGEDGTYVHCTRRECCSENFQLPYRTATFDIYKLQFEQEDPEHMTSIGDNVLFLGHNHSFSLSARDYPHLKPNSIYFADNIHDIFISHFAFRKEGYPYGGHDAGVYCLKDHSVTPLYHPFEFKKILPSPIWVFPAKF